MSRQRTRRNRPCAFALALLLGVAAAALGDAPIVTRAMTASTIAEVFVEREAIRVQLEIGVGDLAGFGNVLPDALFERISGERIPLSERLPVFFSHDLAVRLPDGTPLAGGLKRIEAGRRIVRDEITGTPLPVQPDDAEVVVRAELVYAFGSQPTAVVLKPPTDADGRVVVNIGFVVYHLGLPVTDFRHLSQAETLHLDWEDPWYSRFENRNLRRQNDAPLSAYLYIEFDEVRKEIVVRPKDLRAWIDLRLGASGVIPIADQDTLKQRVADFLAERGTVLIDGKRVEPRLDRIHFIRRTLRTTGVIDPPEDLDINAATLGVIFYYPIAGLPREVTLEWDLFNDRITRVSAAATDEAGGLPSILTADDPVLRWKNFLTNPTVPGMMTVAAPVRRALPMSWAIVTLGTLGLALVVRAISARRSRPKRFARSVAAGLLVLGGALGCLPFFGKAIPLPFSGQPPPVDPPALFTGLLHNVYRAFDARDESVVYDRLAHSIRGELLSEVYLQTRRSIVLENQGGAQVKVDRVEVLETALETRAGDAFRYKCRWTAGGSVGHWGHMHRRLNEYAALLTLEPIEGAWKIVALEILDERRIGPGAPGGG